MFSLFRLCWKVEILFDIVAENGNNIVAGNVAGVDRALFIYGEVGNNDGDRRASLSNRSSC